MLISIRLKAGDIVLGFHKGKRRLNSYKGGEETENGKGLLKNFNQCRLGREVNMKNQKTKIEKYIRRAYILLEETNVFYDYDNLIDVAHMIQNEEETNE